VRLLRLCLCKHLKKGLESLPKRNGELGGQSQLRSKCSSDHGFGIRCRSTGTHCLKFSHGQALHGGRCGVWCVQRPWRHGRDGSPIGSIRPARNNVLANMATNVAFHPLYVIVPAYVADRVALPLGQAARCAHSAQLSSRPRPRDERRKSKPLALAPRTRSTLYPIITAAFTCSGMISMMMRCTPRHVGMAVAAPVPLRRVATVVSPSRRATSPMVVGEGTTKRVDGPPANLQELEASLTELRKAHPGAIIERYLDRVPRIADDVLLCAGAAVVGDVRLAEGASVWYGSVLRGDMNFIEIGAHSNIQDGTVVHLGDNNPTVIAEHVVVGHRAVLHGCTIERHCLIGMQATVLDGATIGEGSIVGAGAIVSAGAIIPPLSLVLGVPGKVVKTLPAEKANTHRMLAEKYARLAHNYRHG
jgi:carbonic anhydrase/acetyltransferase-like protein (isoleucine patch superfamily)